jgi:hypothetical protein
MAWYSPHPVPQPSRLKAIVRNPIINANSRAWWCSIPSPRTSVSSPVSHLTHWLMIDFGVGNSTPLSQRHPTPSPILHAPTSKDLQQKSRKIFKALPTSPPTLIDDGGRGDGSEGVRGSPMHPLHPVYIAPLQLLMAFRGLGLKRSRGDGMLLAEPLPGLLPILRIRIRPVQKD